MPEKRTISRAKKKAKAGRSPSTQAGEFVRDEIHHVREGKHGAKNAKQAIAIGLSKARRSGVKLPSRNRKQALESRRASVKAEPSARRSKAMTRVARSEPRSAASQRALSRQTRASAKARGPMSRRLAAKKAVKTKGPRALSVAGKRAARSRQKGMS